MSGLLDGISNYFGNYTPIGRMITKGENLGEATENAFIETFTTMTKELGLPEPENKMIEAEQRAEEYKQALQEAMSHVPDNE